MNTLNIKLDINNFFLYLNSVGGHSLFIEISPQYLIKSSNENEINFYLSNIKLKSHYCPNFVGVINDDSKEFNIIEIYVNQCKTFFRNFVKKMKIKSNDINIENDIKFTEKFENFINESNQFINLNSSFNKLEEILIYYFNNSINKLKWILFSFIKWSDHFLSYKFIILQNLTYNMKNPAILDIKLGSTPKISKDNLTIKKYEGASKEIGCRIMGIQKGNVFKNRYDTKHYSLKQFKNEISEFFKFNNFLITKTINKTLRVIKEFEMSVKVNLKFSSLLIVYDDIKNNQNIDINLIDFAFLGEKNNLNITNDLISSIKKFIHILKEFQKNEKTNYYCKRE
jgi:hypothetical protein